MAVGVRLGQKMAPFAMRLLRYPGSGYGAGDTTSTVLGSTDRFKMMRIAAPPISA